MNKNFTQKIGAQRYGSIRSSLETTETDLLIARGVEVKTSNPSIGHMQVPYNHTPLLI